MSLHHQRASGRAIADTLPKLRVKGVSSQARWIQTHFCRFPKVVSHSSSVMIFCDCFQRNANATAAIESRRRCVVRVLWLSNSPKARNARKIVPSIHRTKIKRKVVPFSLFFKKMIPARGPQTKVASISRTGGFLIQRIVYSSIRFIDKFFKRWLGCWLVG